MFNFEFLFIKRFTDLAVSKARQLSCCYGKRFHSTFVIRTAEVWISLLASVFPYRYNPGLFQKK